MTKISKFYTGINNILLISVEPEELTKPIELKKVDKAIIIDGNRIELIDYYDKYSKELKILGLLSNMKEKQFKPFIILDKIYKEKMNFATKRFRQFIDSVDWNIEDNKTLVIRF